MNARMRNTLKKIYLVLERFPLFLKITPLFRNSAHLYVNHMLLMTKNTIFDSFSFFDFRLTFSVWNQENLWKHIFHNISHSILCVSWYICDGNIHGVFFFFWHQIISYYYLFDFLLIYIQDLTTINEDVITSTKELGLFCFCFSHLKV